MVATTDLGFPVRLEGLVASAHGEHCNYEPELFPGLIYRLTQPKMCILVFVSGKVRKYGVEVNSARRNDGDSAPWMENAAKKSSYWQRWVCTAHCCTKAGLTMTMWVLPSVSCGLLTCGSYHINPS